MDLLSLGLRGAFMGVVALSLLLGSCWQSKQARALPEGTQRLAGSPR